ncbi:hypothetical protein ACHAW5_007125 [Stephanodiscus triporus]|uniref:Uncharacterized protein n=1 Tax=Stephanodiscus triporus TaxID=2934178 RepID=A0ABD3NY67_9STRA
MTSNPSNNPSDDDGDDAPHRAMLLSLTTSQFHDALARHIDEFKPDPLARRQIENLNLRWIGIGKEEEEERPSSRIVRGRGRRRMSPGPGGGGHHRPEDAADDIDDDNDDDWESVCGGTLVVSSEHISIVLEVDCEWRTMKAAEDRDVVETGGGMRLVGGVCAMMSRGVGGVDVAATPHSSSSTTTTTTVGGGSYFGKSSSSIEDEFHFRLSVYADFPSSDAVVADGGDDGSAHGVPNDNLSIAKNGTKSEEGRKKKKGRSATKTRCDNILRSGMRERLLSNPSVRCLLLVEGEGVPLLLCEALIRRGRSIDDGCGGGGGGGGALEERVDVNDGALDGIRNAIFGQTEDNLDVLEILLNMPYLPRRTFSSGVGVGGEGGGEGGEGADPTPVLRDATTTSTTTLRELAQRAYLRLLEDAMFDACENEGEDELLDDLNIS